MRIVLLAAVLVVTTMPAFAHTGATSTTGFMSGLGHPLLGLDHLLTMVCVGLFASFQGGRALWLVPASFVLMMVAGAAVSMAGVALPLVEMAIAVSVVVMGAAVALGRSLPVAGAMALVGVFAIFHGHAHGSEIPLNTSMLAYAAGFVISTSLLHAAGVGLGMVAGLGGKAYGRTALRIGGAATSAVGAGLLAGVM